MGTEARLRDRLTQPMPIIEQAELIATGRVRRQVVADRLRQLPVEILAGAVRRSLDRLDSVHYRGRHPIPTLRIAEKESGPGQDEIARCLRELRAFSPLGMAVPADIAARPFSRYVVWITAEVRGCGTEATAGCRTGNTAAAAHGCRPGRKRPLVERSVEAASLRPMSDPVSCHRQDPQAGKLLLDRCSGSGHHPRSQSTATPIAAAFPQSTIDRSIVPPMSSSPHSLDTPLSERHPDRAWQTCAASEEPISQQQA